MKAIKEGALCLPGLSLDTRAQNNTKGIVDKQPEVNLCSIMFYEDGFRKLSYNNRDTV
jgi:hypothetical protein